jgi:hypothetical protein
MNSKNPNPKKQQKLLNQITQTLSSVIQGNPNSKVFKQNNIISGNSKQNIKSKNVSSTGFGYIFNLLDKGYDITKKFIVDKTNPEKNVIINISKIKKITRLVKNDCIYIDITNLIGDYNFSNNLNENKYFEDDALLNTIIYSIISNNENNKDNKNLIIYFMKNMGYNQNIYIYNVNENRQYPPITI